MADFPLKRDYLFYKILLTSVVMEGTHFFKPEKKLVFLWKK